MAKPLAFHIIAGNLTRAAKVTFVPYMGGNINYCETSGNDDVMSGMFTGCIMSTYKVGDKRRVAHVHAGEPNDCKDVMKKLLDLNTEINSFKPYEDRRDGDFVFKNIGRDFMVFGVVTAANIPYSIFTKRDPNKKDYHVVKVENQRSRPYKYI
tara:strand:- start:16 stop:474 length:459 start_codon:yes stop_codon:yes gene_type:complete